MSTLKVNEIDSKTGTTVSIAPTKTLSIPAGVTLDVAGTQTVSGTVNLASSTLTLPATLPATIGTNITQLPGANITGTIPAAALSNVDTTGIQADIALLGFKVAANGSLAKYNLVDQTVDGFQDDSGVNASSSANEHRNLDGNYFVGATSAPPTTATGGTITIDGEYSIHSFTANGNYINSAAQPVEYLVVGGGAGGGHSNGNSGGGGGAGGYRTATNFPVIAGTFAVVVGAGGAAGSNTIGPSGVASSFSTISSAGGGGGGSQGVANTGVDGGSGGGGVYIGGAGGGGNIPVTSPSQGNAGGPAINDGSNSAGGGGGGAGAVGGTAYQANATIAAVGVGGAGLASTITGASVYYAGGGAGESYSHPVNVGGVGGGGGSGAAGTANTGGGGGGGSSGGTSRPAGAGGSGIVILKRVTNLYTEGDNLTLVSATTAAEAAPTKGDIVFTYTNGAGTTTLGTDVTAEISADGGSTWTAMTLGSEGSTGSHNIATAHNVTITTTITSPYNMVYRIKTLNQSVSKTTRIQAVSLGWS